MFCLTEYVERSCSACIRTLCGAGCSFVSTWNMGNQLPPTLSKMRLWIPRDGYDVYAIGTQECEYSTDTLAADPAAVSCEKHWVSLVEKAVGGHFQVVAARSLGGTRLVVLTRSSLAHLVHDVRVSSEGTGIANLASNKGDRHAVPSHPPKAHSPRALSVCRFLRRRSWHIVHAG